ncbi:MAG: energy-coupled thiamine transporter ThiT [Clostridiales bacterium]|nr:energy-coupled thiamine transporter ThiT [Clostridiales bacterium]
MFDSFNAFWETPGGTAAAIALCALALALLAGSLYRGKRLSAKTLAYSGICIALSFILGNIKLFSMPQGGSVTAFGSLFIVLVGYWFGPAAGILAGAAEGLLNLVSGPYVIHPAQLLLDYPMGFAALGIAGFFKKGKWGLQIGYCIGNIGRAFFSILSGVIFFASYAGDQNPIIYSTVYNLSYIIPEVVITVAIVSIPAVKGAIDRVGAQLQEERPVRKPKHA